MAEEAVAVPAQFSVRDLADDTNYGVLSAPDKRAIFEQRARNDAQFKEAFPTKDAQELAYEHILHTIWQRASATAPGREAKPVAESPLTNPAAIPDAATRPPSTNPADVPNATTGTLSPMQAVGGVLRGLGLQGFEDTSKYPTPRFTHQPSPEEQEAFKQQRAALVPNPAADVTVAGIRAPLAFASGVAGGTGDVLNTPAVVSQLAGGPNFKLPIGSDSAARTLGIPPESMSKLEHALQNIGGFVSPGMFLKAAEGVGILPSVAQKLYRFFSAGPTGDVILGTASTTGSEVGRLATPGSAVGPLVGGVAGPLTVTGLHAALSQGIKFAGRGTVAEQQAGKAETTLAQAKANTGAAEKELGATTELGKTQMEQATQDATSAETLANQRYQQEVNTQTGFTEAAQGRVTTAESAAQQTFAPLEDILTQDILKTRTMAGTPRAIPQVPPSEQEAGQAALRTIAEAAPQIAQETSQRGAEAGTKLLESLGPRMERMAVLGKAQQWARTFFDQGRENLGTLFNATEKVTGDIPVVSLENLKAAAARTAEQSGQAGGVTRLPRGTGAFGEIGLDTAEVQALLADTNFLKGLTPAQKNVAEKVLAGSTEYTEANVPFWLARRLESAFNAVAYQGAKPIGTLEQGLARKYVSALQDDLHNFYTSEHATQLNPDIEAALQKVGKGDVAGTISNALPAAKEAYGKFINTINRTIISKLLDRNPIVQEQFLHPFTTFGDDLATHLVIKENASPEVWNTLKAFTVGELYRKAVNAGGQFDPAAMVSSLQKLRRSGKMGVQFEPEEIANIERYANSLTATDLSHLPNFRAALAKKEPSQVIDFAFEKGPIEQTQNFKSVVSPETFDSGVKAWTASFLQDLVDLTPAQIYTKLKPLAYRGNNGNAASRLDVMFTEYPGVADKMTALVDTYNPRLRQVETAQTALRQTGTQSEEILSKASQVAGQEKATAQTEFENVKAEVASAKSQAQTRVEDAQDVQRWAQDRYKDLRKKANIPEGVESVYGYMRAGGIHVRATGGAMLVLALMETGITALSGNPLWAIPGVAVAGGALTFDALATTRTGQYVIRRGLEQRYSPSAVRWTLNALGAANASEEQPPQ